MAEPRLVDRAEPRANHLRRRIVPREGAAVSSSLRCNLAAVRILNQVIQEQDSAIGSATWTLDEASVRYHSGIDSYLKVITAQTALLNAREATLTF